MTTGGPAEVQASLDAHDYLADEGLATAIFLAQRLERPLLLEGEPGAGKTEVANALHRASGGRLLRLQCYEGIDRSESLYAWDHARQLLHLRLVEVAGLRGGAEGDRSQARVRNLGPERPVTEGHKSGKPGGPQIGGHLSAEPLRDDPRSIIDREADLYQERFLLPRPLLDAIRHDPADGPPPVLLIDELDRADDEFEAFLLELLADWAVTIPELGRIEAKVAPRVVITSNRTRELHEALKRRCLYHWLDHPDAERERAIIERRVPEVSPALAAAMARLVATLRTLPLVKSPGVAEAIDGSLALHALGVDRLDIDAVHRTLGTLVKHREDLDLVRSLPAHLVLGGAAP